MIKIPTQSYLLAFFTWLSCTLSAGPLYAETFTVSRSQGSGEGSLPWAISQASLSPGPHRIVFAAKTDEQEMVLDATLALGGELTLVGNGQDKTIISGKSAVRLLAIDGKSRIQLENLTLKDGKTPATGRQGSPGAAIYMKDGTLTIKQVRFRGHQADWGGAVAIENGQALFEQTEWQDNQQQALALRGGSVRLLNNSFSDNRGGAIMALGGTLDIADSRFINNQGTNSGAILVRNATATLTRVTLENNRVETLQKTGSQIDASGQGGAINVQANGNVSLDAVTLAHNRAEWRGGAVNISGGGHLSVRNSTFSGNQAEQGSAISINPGQVTLESATIMDSRVGASDLRAAIWLKGPTAKISIHNSIVAGTRHPDLKPAWDTGSESADSFDIKFSLIETPGQAAPAASAERKQIQAEPGLGPLADNGGPTQTHALLERSPAIGMGEVHSATLGTDQRGHPRKQEKTQDMGAFEQQSVP